jgi:hypothetical protein
LNYFNYFTEVEDAFVRRRGKHLLVSSLDWALIETWKQIGIPLHVVLSGIERAFDRWEARPQKRAIKSLLYCQEEIEAQYAEWMEARVGVTEGASEKNAEDEDLPFSRTAVLEHLKLVRLALMDAFAHRKQEGEDDFSEALLRAVTLLDDMTRDFAESASPDARRLEDSLTGLERMLSDAISRVISEQQLKTMRREVANQLKPYRAHMEKAVYQQTLDNLLLKRLREHFAVPRLSLFYL